MSKQRWIGLAVAILVIAGGLTTWVIKWDTSSSDVDNLKQNEGIVDPGFDGNLATGTTTTAPVATTTTAPSVRSDSNPSAADKTEVAFRSPIRCDVGGEPRAGALPGDDPNGAKRWVTVQALSGSCDKTSSSFALRGIDTRLAWRSDASTFNAFLVDSADTDAAAGFSDADCPSACSEYQAITIKAGNYTMRVQADSGPWQIVVQEYR